MIYPSNSGSLYLKFTFLHKSLHFRFIPLCLLVNCWLTAVQLRWIIQVGWLVMEHELYTIITTTTTTTKIITVTATLYALVSNSLVRQQQVFLLGAIIDAHKGSHSNLNVCHSISRSKILIISRSSSSNSKRKREAYLTNRKSFCKFLPLSAHNSNNARMCAQLYIHKYIHAYIHIEIHSTGNIISFSLLETTKILARQ